ncbi:MAG: type II toxin-antitoxin system death-on-curing family toxin [Rhizobiaceae bacterium]|nr:type II toxin-antitoxin system death-on-curing family toxin [Rhizobiaceae bacterium]
MTEYHSLGFILAIHAEQLRIHGGAAGVRDVGMLESALNRPLQKATYGEPDLCELAAAYIYGIARNHPFVDGNKRTALAAADMFLYFNGLDLQAEDEDLIQFVQMLAGGEIDQDGAAAFFRDHTAPLA